MNRQRGEPQITVRAEAIRGAWVMWNGTWVFAKGTGEIEGPD